jgi:hypothetical protein
MPLEHEQKTRIRRATRGWLAVLLMALALAFGVPLVLPFVVPVEIPFGGKWVRVEAGVIPAAQRSWIDPGPGYTEFVGQPTAVMGIHSANPLMPVFQTAGDYHWWWYRAGDLMYSIEVFDGRRWQPGAAAPAVKKRSGFTGGQ